MGSAGHRRDVGRAAAGHRRVGGDRAEELVESFPGFDPRLVAAEPPYNEHLVTDVGAGFLATGVVLLVAAVWANRAAIGIALLAFVAFTLPHVVYHATNPSDASPASRTRSTSYARQRSLCARRCSRGASAPGEPAMSPASGRTSSVVT